MIKYYVLDTSVLLYDPTSLTAFLDSHVVIPETVLDELDRKKNLQTQVGKHARAAIRQLKYLSEKGKELNVDILTGVPCDKHGGTVRFFSEVLEDIPDRLSKENPDHKILSVAVTFKKKHLEDHVYLVTRDTSLELKALIHQVATYDYSGHSTSLYTGYTGYFLEIKPSKTLLAKLYEKQQIRLPKRYCDAIEENGFIIFKNPQNKKRNKKAQDTIVQLKSGTISLCDDRYMLQAHTIKPMNHEQYFALSLLLDPDIDLVTINGQAGSGKTLLALAAGLSQIEVGMPRQFKKIMFARSLTPVGGKDQIGFLRGSLEDKLAPWTMPVIDNIDVIMKSPVDPTTGDKYSLYQYLVKDGSLEIAALQYIRGRTLTDTFLIIDECQNITRNEISSIITRIGQGSKVVLIGDNLQIDAPYLSTNDNALVHVIEAFRGSKLAGHVTLSESVRSELAKEAIERIIK